MYLTLLGGLCLEDDGVVLSGRATQNRRLAILALLAAAPARTMSRDKAMGLLWPEKEEEQGRHLLSVGLHDIRKSLGEDVIVSRGDDLVLDGDRLPSDLDQLRNALEHNDLERAVELYRGPFLDGFYLRGGSPAFDEWVAETRQRCETEYRRALEALALRRDAAGDRMGATEAWRRLAAADRYNTRVAMELVRALDAVANRAGALQFARVHQALLREEFGTEPHPDFTRLVAALQRPDGTDPPPALVHDEPAPIESPPAEAPPAEAPEAEPAADDHGAEERGPERPVRSGVTGRPTRRLSAWPGAWARRALRSPRWRAAFLTVALLGAGAGLLSRWAWDRFLPDPTPDEQYVDIVVLPLTAVNSTDEAWADGLTESLIETLSRAEGVRVTVRSAAFSLRGSSVAEAIRRLRVDHVLTGTARRDGDRIRIGLELSGADGFTDWTDSYDRHEADVVRFETWDEIATAVLSQLEVELGRPTATASPGGTQDLVAYDFYLKGRRNWFSRTPEGFAGALQYFTRAVERDPQFARALVGIADVYNLLGAYDYGLLHPDSAYPRARRAARRAIELAPKLAEAHAALAYTLYAYDRDWVAADSAYRRSIALDPRLAEAHHWYSQYLLATGRRQAAIDEVTEGLALDSLSPVINGSVGRHHYLRGQYDASLTAYAKSLELDPDFVPSHLGRGLTLMSLDRPEDAERSFLRALELVGPSHPLSLTLIGYARARAGSPMAARETLATLDAIRGQGHYVPAAYDAILYAALGEMEAGIDALERALEENSGAVVFLRVEPLVDPFRGHPRFEALIDRVGIPAPERGLFRWGRSG